MTQKDEVIATREVKMTKDYTRFKTLPGNREVNHQHVKQLQRLMVDNGNLTAEFPIILGTDGYVIDGQHRLEALKGLGWEVGYIVEDSATVTTVRAINQGNRNWSWEDILYSYASMGNENYKWLVAYFKNNDVRVSTAMAIIAASLPYQASAATVKNDFTSGDLVIEGKSKIYDLTSQLLDIQRLVEIPYTDFCLAVILLMRSPSYDHDRMLTKLRSLGHELPTKARKTVYMRALEDMYNHSYSDENKVRLF